MGSGLSQMGLADFLQKYVKCDPKDVEREWAAEYNDNKYCSHGPNCKNKATCDVGKRIITKHVLTGSLLDSMRSAERIVSRKYANDYKMKVVRVVEKDNDEPKDGGQSVVAVEVPRVYIDHVLEGLSELGEEEDV